MMVEIERRDDVAKAGRLWKRLEWVVKAATSEGDDDEPVIDAVQAADGSVDPPRGRGGG
jgi:hypothetical protein